MVILLRLQGIFGVYFSAAFGKSKLGDTFGAGAEKLVFTVQNEGKINVASFVGAQNWRNADWIQAGSASANQCVRAHSYKQRAMQEKLMAHAR